MLAHLLRRWSNIGQALVQCLVFAVSQQTRDIEPMLHSKHETLNQCLTNVGPPSTTLVQQWSSIGSMSRVCWDIHGVHVRLCVRCNRNAYMYLQIASPFQIHPYTAISTAIVVFNHCFIISFIHSY